MLQKSRKKKELDIESEIDSSTEKNSAEANTIPGADDKDTSDSNETMTDEKPEKRKKRKKDRKKETEHSENEGKHNTRDSNEKDLRIKDNENNNAVDVPNVIEPNDDHNEPRERKHDGSSGVKDKTSTRDDDQEVNKDNISSNASENRKSDLSVDNDTDKHTDINVDKSARKTRDTDSPRSSSGSEASKQNSSISSGPSDNDTPQQRRRHLLGETGLSGVLSWTYPVYRNNQVGSLAAVRTPQNRQCPFQILYSRTVPARAVL